MAFERIEQRVTAGLVGVLGLFLLGSYVPLFRQHRQQQYDFWLGLPSAARPVLYLLMGFAAAGFVAMLWDYVSRPLPTTGLFGKHTSIFPTLIAVLLLASALWSIFTLQVSKSKNNTKALKGWAAGASVSLVVVALCSILFIAGQAERVDPSSAAVVGSLFFGLVTILVDAVLWNSRLLVQVFGK